MSKKVFLLPLILKDVLVEYTAPGPGFILCTFCSTVFLFASFLMRNLLPFLFLFLWPLLRFFLLWFLSNLDYDVPWFPFSCVWSPFIVFIKFGKVFGPYLFKYFFLPPLCPAGMPVMCVLGFFELSHKSLVLFSQPFFPSLFHLVVSFAIFKFTNLSCNVLPGVNFHLVKFSSHTL